MREKCWPCIIKQEGVCVCVCFVCEGAMETSETGQKGDGISCIRVSWCFATAPPL